MNKLIKCIKNPKRILLFLMYRFKFAWIKDEAYLKIKYKLVFNKKLNLEKPETFNEKIQWLKLYDRKPEYINMVDKLEAKKYVGNIIGEEYIIQTLGVWNRFEEINFEELPNKFVLKCTHDSGGIVICKDKNRFNMIEAKRKINRCLKRNYYYYSREWPYKNIIPRIIAEEYLEDNNRCEINDYKLMCYNGKVKNSFVCSGRNTAKGLHVDFFDLNWELLPFERVYPKSEDFIERPSQYEKMIELAEILSKNIPFVRVDFYEVKGKIYFGELTFYPGSGMESFSPDEWDKKLGDLIELPKEKSVDE